MEASSAGGEIWDAVRRSLKRPLLCSQIWDDRLAHGQTDRQTDRRTRKKTGPPAKTYRVARALFSRGRLISEASLPVFQRGWGRILACSARSPEDGRCEPLHFGFGWLSSGVECRTHRPTRWERRWPEGVCANVCASLPRPRPRPHLPRRRLQCIRIPRIRHVASCCTPRWAMRHPR
jgi:hypothetical protein